MRSWPPTPSLAPTWFGGKLNIPTLCSLLLVVWVGISALFDTSQLNDSLELLIWGQSPEWGYWKHPPLASWLVWGGIRLVPTPYLATYLLGAILAVGTLWASWKIAELLFDRTTADLTAVLLTLHYGFTRRAAVFNHNTLLLCLVAICVLLALLALRNRSMRLWIATGVATGIAGLAKYQAAIPMVGVLAALMLSRQISRLWWPLIVAALCALLVMGPHLHWIYQHDFETVGYALSYANDEPGPDSALFRLGAFLTNQLRFVLPMMVFALLLHFTACAATRRLKMTPGQKAWMIGLVGFPLMFFVLSALLFQVRLQSQWGLQTTQFMPMLFAAWIRQHWGDWSRAHTQWWLGIEIVTLVLFAGQSSALLPNPSHGAALKGTPAHAIAEQAAGFWAAKTNCPLRYVSGETSAAAMIASYARSGQEILVLQEGDPEKGPWIDIEQMERAGYLDAKLSSTGDPDGFDAALPLPTNKHRPTDQPEYLLLKYHAPTAPQCGG